MFSFNIISVKYPFALRDLIYIKITYISLYKRIISENLGSSFFVLCCVFFQCLRLSATLQETALCLYLVAYEQEFIFFGFPKVYT